MNILFFNKFYMPFDRGGSEWSTRDLAYLLTKDGHKVTIVTPNFGAKSQEIIDGVKIIRIPFPIKLKNKKGQIAPFWTSNLTWFFYSSVFCLYIFLKNKYEVIHVQNNEWIPAAVITAKLFRKKTVATFRDYQAICNLGFCLWNSNKVCDFKKYMDYDFEFFYENYVDPKSDLRYWLLKAAAIRGWFVQKILYYFAKKIDYKIAVSKKVKEIFEVNGIKNIKVIYNPILIKNTSSTNTNNKITYVGKLSKGKGVDILFETISGIFKKNKDLTFEIIGTGYLERQLKEFAQEKGISSKVVFSGHLPHGEVLEKVGQSALVIVPSVWPEPLPRSVIETILSGTPVVATSVGGIGEIIKNKVYGLLSDTNVESLEKAIMEGYQKRDTFRKNIKRDINDLRKKFLTDSVKEYEQIYSEAVK